MNNEPVAYVDPIWMDRPDLVMSHQLEIGKLFARTQFTNYVPLYTHPAKPIDKPDECINGCPKNQTCDYCAGIKTLTDEEIVRISETCDLNHVLGLIDFARAILRKAQEKC
jgi:hypothetical protein